MKHLYTIIILSLILLSCGGKQEEKSVTDIIATHNLPAMIQKKEALLKQQQIIASDLKLLNNKIEESDQSEKMKLVSTQIVKPQIFNHYLELQGNVSTKNLLTLTPEFSGILSRVYVTEGQKVKKGQLLAKIDDGGMSQQLAQIKIQANLAQTTFERQERLWNQKIGSEMQYLQAKSNYEAQQKMVTQVQKQIAKTNLKAPFSGTIDEIITEQGSVVGAGQSPILRIVNLADMYIETDVSEKHISQVIKGKNAVVEIPVIGKKLNAKIRQVGSFINPANRTFKVEIAIPNPDKTIKPNLTAKLKINDYTNPNALLIPQSIISENAAGEQYIYTIKDRKNNIATVVKTFIKTGLTNGDNIEVINTLKPNTEIIIEGARVVKENQKIEIVK